MTKRGAILLLWLAEVGELCNEEHKYLHYFIDDHRVVRQKLAGGSDVILLLE